MTNFINIDDFTDEQLVGLIDQAIADKQALKNGTLEPTLKGRTLAMYFEKPSLRTRVSFETAMTQLGGAATYLTPSDIGLGTREPVRDVARVLGRMCDAIMARTFSHELVETLGEWSPVPVINALTDYSHPCQALADLMTIREHLGGLRGRKLAYVGDGNNVAHSLLVAGALSGMKVTVVGPRGFEPNLRVFDRAREIATAHGAEVAYTSDPAEGVAGADAVYTDVWASMGQESEAAARRRLFEPYQVNAELFGKAAPHALFMHCLPAHRGDEVTDEIADHARSVIFDEAENRMHAIKAVYVALITDSI